jgi:hypothetical protein
MAVLTHEKQSGEKTRITHPTTSPDLAPGDVLHHAEVQKPFNLWSTLGISFSITSTPIAIGTYLSVSIGVGGSPVFFFGFILSVVLDLIICASLAEMAAVFPHSSGWWPFWAAVFQR